MREISYRAWLKDEKKLVEVKSIHFGTKKIMYGYSEGSHCYGNVTCKFDDCELMQYTGFTDKNGKPIFDGDIVGCFGNTQIFEIKWCDVRGGYFLDNIRMSGVGECRPECLGNLTDTLEVIGNIYDNPELLEWVE